jgi:hypothetical protein
MKKIASFVIIFAICITFLLSVNCYAASLDTISVNLSKTNVKPGEEVSLTINFGEKLGAYTFDIAYDNNIFEYISVTGGTANDTSDKVRVTFYDSTGGTSPRENMSITFKAKEDLTTSNPTEFTVVGEGLANADASVSYDDIQVPLVKNVVVEPEYKDYEIKLEHTGEIVKGEEKDVTLTFSSSMGKYYDHARLIGEAVTPTGATVKLTGLNEQEDAEQDIIQSGWGDPQGYKIGGKNFSQVLKLKALFSDEGEYKLTLKLIDRDDSDTIIAEKSSSFTVLAEATKNTENVSEVINSSNVVGNVQTEMPKELPKTGINFYIPAAIIMFVLVAYIIYYNMKNKK